MTRQQQSRKKSKSADPYEGMTRKEKATAIARLGGLARAKALTPEQRSRISAKGGLACYLQYGAEHYSKITKEHWYGQTAAELKKSLDTLAATRARKNRATIASNETLGSKGPRPLSKAKLSS